MADIYTVIEFCKDGAFECVPRTWLQFITGADYCYCYFPKQNAGPLIRRADLPDTERWPCYRVKILRMKVTYDRGVELTRRMISKGNLDSSSGESGKKKRKPVEPARFTPVEDDNSEEENEIVPSTSKIRKTKDEGPTSQFKPHKKVSLPKPPTKFERLPMSSGKEQKTTTFKYVTATTTKKTKSASQPEQSTMAAENDTYNWTQALEENENNRDYDMTEELRREDSTGYPASDNIPKGLQIQISNILDNQKQMMSMLRRLTVEAPLEEETVKELVLRPCSTVQELLDLDSTLEDDTLRRKFRRYMATMGNDKLSKTVIRIMSFIATRKVWCSYSLDGQKGKGKLREMHIYEVILLATREVHRSAKESKVAKCIGDLLKHSPQVVKTQKKRQKQKEQEEEHHHELDVSEGESSDEV